MKIFDFQFLMYLYILGCPDHDLTVSAKCLSGCVCVCDKYLASNVTQELMHRT